MTTNKMCLGAQKKKKKFNLQSIDILEPYIIVAVVIFESCYDLLL